ncbi:hypothetical protein AYO44_01560 [Planctomycetaceae bacterium SCGC AG-212-F19]|nr:hypothetical protein AYO44_01560 [Planctomycetaceae bacterium SCGC AG-212-F19]
MNFFSKLLEWAVLPFFLLGRFIRHCNSAFKRRWKYSLLLMLVLLGIHLYMRLHHEGGVYAAIAFSPSTGVYGSASECSSLADAERIAKTGCHEADVRIVAWAHNSWCALALSEGNTYGIGLAHTRQAAERLALEHCRGRSQKPCYVAVAVGTGKEDAPPPPEGTYAAIAYSRSTGRDGSADQCATVAEAERLAVQRCDAPDAHVVVWANHDWCALAVGEDKAFGFAWGRSRAEVEKQALDHCRGYTKTPCRIAAVVFGGMTEHGGTKSEQERSGAK